MGRSNPQTQAKRQREQAKKDKRRAKDERRAARKADREAGIAEEPEVETVVDQADVEAG